MIEVTPLIKEMIAMGITPMTAIVAVIAWRLNNSLNGIDKRLALLEQKTQNCDKC